MRIRRNGFKNSRFMMAERLEKRDLPATWGVAWPDPSHLTLSFVPDGTMVQGQSSQLFQKLDAQLGQGKWQSAILDAYQTWAMNTNINLGVVSDGGQPIGTVGPAEGDPRFGDIRISAVPLPAGVVAITSPFDPSTGTTSGDLVINSNADFSSGNGYDLFTVALHEAGHSFGFADSGDPSSFMYDVYTGKQTGLGAGAVPALQALYGGARNSLTTIGASVSKDPANPIDITSQIAAGSNAVSYGDLDAIGSANYFQFQAPLVTVAPKGIDIQVRTAGISQLVPRIVVTDAFGNVVKSASTTSTADGGVTIHLDLLIPGKLYNIKVDGPSADLHSIGSYQLSVSPTITVASLVPNFSSSAPIGNNNGVIGSTPSTSGATILSTNQVNDYRFSTPVSTLVTSVTVQLQVYGVGLVPPQIAIYNSLGTLLTKTTATSPSQSTLTLRLDNVLPLTGYVVRVTNGTVNASNFGAFQVAVSTGTAAANMPNMILQTPWLGSQTSKLSTPNTTIGTAAQLNTPAGHLSGSYYAAMAGIGNGQTAQFYRIKTPDYLNSGYATIAVQAIGASNLIPWLTVTDRSGNAVPVQVLTQSSGVSVIQVPFTGSNEFVIKVAASAAGGGQSTGNYYLNAAFGIVASSLSNLSAGVLAPGAAGTANLTTPSAGVYQFVLSGSSANTGTDAMLRLTVRDSSGNVMLTLTCLASEAMSATVLLPAGNYSLYVDTYSPSGATLPPLSYSLFGTNLTDPVKVYSSTGGGSSPPTS